MHALRSLLAPLVAGLALHGETLSPVPSPGAPAPLRIHCTPSSIQQRGKDEIPAWAKNPIAEALSAAKPGTVISLDPGDYPAITIGFQSHSPANTSTQGGEAGNPIIVEGRGPGVRIVGSAGDTIAIDQRVPNGWITFRNITIVPGKRAGVMFYQRRDKKVHRGYTFEDCHILGNFDTDKGEGKRTKWGVWGQNLADFRFAGVTAPARIENISEEHAFYLQNVQGAITIENVHAKDLGRTFCQFTARSDGPAGKGDVVIRNCVVEDACIAQADGFKGGAAFTIAGRMQGSFLFENNVYKAGFRPKRKRFTVPGHPYGTGAFTAWEEGQNGRTAVLVLRDNDFSFAEGCGDRPVVAIGGCKKVLIVGKNRFVSGGIENALAFDPVGRGGETVSRPNQSVYLAPATEIVGSVSIRGKPANDEQLADLRKEGLDLPTDEEPAEGG